MDDTDSDLRTQLEAAQAITHIGSWRWDLASGVVTWSDELYRIYGLPPRSQSITLEFFLSCVHPEDRSRIQCEVDSDREHLRRRRPRVVPAMHFDVPQDSPQQWPVNHDIERCEMPHRLIHRRNDP